MPRYYTYLISSLPALSFNIEPPFSYEKFLLACASLISDKEISLLRSLNSPGQSRKLSSYFVLKQWHASDTALRNELVKLRAARKKEDPQKYLRQAELTDSSMPHIASKAFREPSLMRAEKILDEARWRVLDDLSAGHYFDFDFLILYALKLRILNRWQIINSGNNPQILEEVIGA